MQPMNVQYIRWCDPEKAFVVYTHSECNAAYTYTITGYWLVSVLFIFYLDLLCTYMPYIRYVSCVPNVASVSRLFILD